MSSYLLINLMAYKGDRRGRRFKTTKTNPGHVSNETIMSQNSLLIKFQRMMANSDKGPNNWARFEYVTLCMNHWDMFSFSCFALF